MRHLALVAVVALAPLVLAAEPPPVPETPVEQVQLHSVVEACQASAAATACAGSAVGEGDACRTARCTATVEAGVEGCDADCGGGVQLPGELCGVGCAVGLEVAGFECSNCFGSLVLGANASAPSACVDCASLVLRTDAATAVQPDLLSTDRPPVAARCGNQDCVGIAPAEDSRGFLAVSGTGDATGTAGALSLTGAAESEGLVAVSVLGPSAGGAGEAPLIAVAPRGDADGAYPFSLTGACGHDDRGAPVPCVGWASSAAHARYLALGGREASGLAALVLRGSAEAPAQGVAVALVSEGGGRSGHAVAAAGPAEGGWAVSGTGPARGDAVAVSAAGEATCTGEVAPGGPCVAVSVCGALAGLPRADVACSIAAAVVEAGAVAVAETGVATLASGERTGAAAGRAAGSVVESAERVLGL